MAQKIQSVVKDLSISHHASPTKEYVTISIGIADCIPNEGKTTGQLIKAADKALYLAKQQGRDRIMLTS